MNISEHLALFVRDNLNAKHVFTLTGGGAMFLNDAFGNTSSLNAIYCHHEQAAAMAAVGYSKLNGIGVCVTTTGCGATNALTGLLDAWQDNIPVLFISGQVKCKETSYLSKASLRTFGVQEFNIIPIVEKFTKASYFIDTYEKYIKVLEKIEYDLFEGRPGPVWLDIPLDLQSKILESNEKISPSQKSFLNNKRNSNIKELSILRELVHKYKKPVILVGNGLRLSKNGNGISKISEMAKEISIPVVSTYLGADFFTTSDNFYFGVVGIKANRIANLIVQNADLLITIGTRLATSVIGFEYELFSKNSLKVVVDIDIEEHRKETLKIDHFINMDADEFVTELSSITKNLSYSNWFKNCNKARKLLPRKEQTSSDDSISIYDVVDIVSTNSNADDVIVSDAGSSYYVTSMIFSKKENQRYVTSGAQADMGFAVPAAIGCAFSKDNKSRIHVITGDGSFQLNIQELQTIVNYQLNISIYVLNNDGYLSIRATQNNFFKGRSCGTDKSNGVSFPNLEKISKAYGIKFFRFSDTKEMSDFLNDQKIRGPILVEVICPKDEAIIPRTTTVKDEEGNLKSGPLSLMNPLLSEDLIKKLSMYDLDI